MPVISIEKQKADVLRTISDWGETLVFRSAPGEAGRTVVGVVTRNDAGALDELPNSGAPAFKVMVVNNAAPTMISAGATIKGSGSAELASEVEAAAANQGQSDTLLGIGISEIREGISTIDIARRPGETPKSRTIRRIDDSDEAALFLECR